jgi:hypothetical protein
MSESAGPEATANDSREWLAAVVRGGRYLVWAPAVWFAVTPLAVVWHRPMVVAAALFQLFGTWLVTWRSKAPLDPGLGRLGWLLRGIALSGVPVVYASSLGYRALLLMELAVRAFYFSRLAPRLGKPSWAKLFLWSAGGCAVGAVLLSVDLAWRVFTHALTLDPWGSRLVGLSAVPFVAGGWLLLAELVATQSDTGERPWWEYGLGVVVNLGLASALVVASGVGGFTISWLNDGEPGVMRCAIALCLLIGTGTFLGLPFAIRPNHARLRRGIAVYALVQAPLIWTLLFRPEFSSERWKRFARENGGCDGSMAEDLVYSPIVIGKTRPQVKQLLGPPTMELGLGPGGTEWANPKPPRVFLRYNFRDERPCRGLDVMFEQDVVSETQFFLCDD